MTNTINDNDSYYDLKNQTAEYLENKIMPDDSASQANFNSLRNSNELGLAKMNQVRDFRATSLPQINEQTLENFNKQSIDLGSNRSNSPNQEREYLNQESPLLKKYDQ